MTTVSNISLAVDNDLYSHLRADTDDVTNIKQAAIDIPTVNIISVFLTLFSRICLSCLDAINKIKKLGVSLQGEYFERWLLALGFLGGAKKLLQHLMCLRM